MHLAAAYLSLACRLEPGPALQLLLARRGLAANEAAHKLPQAIHMAISGILRAGCEKTYVWGASSTPARRPRRIFPSLHASRSLARFCGSRHRRLVLLHELCRAARLPASRSTTGYEAGGRPAPAPSTEALASDRFQ